jgi:hypothetical protein
MQDEVFPLNLVLKYVKSSYIHAWSTKPDPSELDNEEPNQGLHHPISL